MRVREGPAMTTLALFAAAALAFSVLAGLFEVLIGRRTRRRFQRRPSPVLHPLPQHGVRRVRHPLSGRAVHAAGLFFGFLVVTYVGLLLLRALHGVVAKWF